MQRPVNFRKGFGVAGLWLALTFVTGPAAVEQTPVRVGVLTDNYPFSFREADDRVQGFSYELVAEIEQVMGLKLERVVGSTGEINPAFVAGQLDLLQSYVEFTERDAYADFSVPYLTMTGMIFVRKGESRIKELVDLKGRRVLVHRGSLGENVLRQAGLADSILPVDSMEQSLVRLDRGEGDAVLVSRLSGLLLAHRLGLQRLRALPARVPGYEVRYCIAVRKGRPVLLAQINEGLAILVRTGRFDALYRKWFGPVDRGYTAEQVVWAVATGLALALIVAIWAGVKQRALRKRITQQAEALRVSEERHRGIFEGAHDGLLVLGRGPDDLLAEQINPAAGRLLGLAPPPAMGTGLGRLLAADEALVLRLRAAAGRVEEFEHETPGQTWLRVVVSPLGARVLVSLVDITEQVQARARLRKQEELIGQKQKLEAVGTLAGGVAHDFNNLLTAIMGNTELCLMNLPAGHPEAEGLQQVLDASKRARDLVRQILTFSRHAAPGREVVAVGPLVHETIKLLQTFARNRVEFAAELPAGLPPITADPVQVHQVLMNIGTNAVQAMRDHSGRLLFRAETVEVGVELQEQHPGLHPGGYVRIGVQDNGPGMPPEVQARVFEPFYTTKAPGEGTGLGLSVVHGIMQQHDGAVTLYSQVGRGSLFHLYFPVVAAASPVAAAAQPAGPGPGRGEPVLFVDDEPAIVEMALKMLGRLGYRARCCGSAEEAWAEFTARPDEFAVVISDLTMPGMNGLQLLGRLREVRGRQPFVLISGFFSEAERAEAVALKVSLLVAKPLGYQELGRAIATVLERR